jgi:fructosamine-3-kinase
MADTLSAIVEQAFGTRPDHARYLGGTLNQTAQVEVKSDRYFVKWKADAPSHFFEIEARGLNLLRNAGAIRTPQVISHSEASEKLPAFLILEWIDESPHGPARNFAVNFGHALAQLHRTTQDTFGLDFDNFIGELPQSNKLTAAWPAFYRDQRIAPQVALAKQQGYLPPARESLLNKLMDRLEELLSSTTSSPSLLHGDLWSGNFLVEVDDQPVLVDPAVYFGEREVEIAFTELFGGFPSGFLNVYHEAYPLDAGYGDRRALYQLYPLLVHLNLFGESYGPLVDAICRHYTTRS